VDVHPHPSLSEKRKEWLRLNPVSRGLGGDENKKKQSETLSEEYGAMD
jgi:hypothetical protein